MITHLVNLKHQGKEVRMSKSKIELHYDSKMLRALAKYYEGTIEGFIESQLDSLYEDYVPEDVIQAIKDDEAYEKKLQGYGNCTLIRIGGYDEEFCLVSYDEKTFMDVAKRYAYDIKEHANDYSYDSLATYFGEQDILSSQTFSMMAKAFEAEESLNAVVSIDIEGGTIAVREKGMDGYRQFDIEQLSIALNDIRGKEYMLYRDEVEDFEHTLQLYGSEIQVQQSSMDIEM